MSENITQENAKTFSRERLVKIAKYQSLVLYALLVSILIEVAAAFIPLDDSLLPILTIVSLSARAFGVFALFQLGRAMKQNIAITIIVAALQFVPYLNFLILYAMSGSASKILKEHNIKVGLLGANPSSI
ncbi:MAG: hypothetical protein AAFV85_17060 [Cyanobacteria bacterium J06634_6]